MEYKRKGAESSSQQEAGVALKRDNSGMVSQEQCGEWPFPEKFSQHRSLYPEHGGSKVLQNVGILLKHYRASQLRRS
jgi:hypothetical protein